MSSALRPFRSPEQGFAPRCLRQQCPPLNAPCSRKRYLITRHHHATNCHHSEPPAIQRGCSVLGVYSPRPTSPCLFSVSHLRQRQAPERKERRHKTIWVTSYLPPESSQSVLRFDTPN